MILYFTDCLCGCVFFSYILLIYIAASLFSKLTCILASVAAAVGNGSVRRSLWRLLRVLMRSVEPRTHHPRRQVQLQHVPQARRRTPRHAQRYASTPQLTDYWVLLCFGNLWVAYTFLLIGDSDEKCIILEIWHVFFLIKRPFWKWGLQKFRFRKHCFFITWANNFSQNICSTSIIWCATEYIVGRLQYCENECLWLW